MSEKNIIFDNKKINKSNFYRNKKLFKIDDIDVNKILVSKKEPHGNEGSFKYLIGYNDNNVIKRLCIRLLKGLGLLNILKMVRRLCLLRSLIKKCF